MGEGIRDDEVIAVISRRYADKVGDVCGASRARLVLEALVIRLDLVAIDADLDLRGESDVGAGIGR